MAEFSFSYDEDLAKEDSQYRTATPGEYSALAVNSGVETTKSGTGKYLFFDWQIVGGEFDGVRVRSMHNVVNPNDTAVQIGRKQVNKILSVCKKQSISDSSELHNIPVKIKVACEEYNGKIRNVVTEFSSATEKPAPKEEAFTF